MMRNIIEITINEKKQRKKLGEKQNWLRLYAI